MSDKVREDNKNTWKTTIMAELLLLSLIALASLSAWYDLSVTNDKHISYYVLKWTHAEPAMAFFGGCITILFAWVIHIAWRIPFRRVFAVLAIGFVLGHLFWVQTL